MKACCATTGGGYEGFVGFGPADPDAIDCCRLVAIEHVNFTSPKTSASGGAFWVAAPDIRWDAA
jgi:hypothetical protein